MFPMILQTPLAERCSLFLMILQTPHAEMHSSRIRLNRIIMDLESSCHQTILTRMTRGERPAEGGWFGERTLNYVEFGF